MPTEPRRRVRIATRLTVALGLPVMALWVYLALVNTKPHVATTPLDLAAPATAVLAVEQVPVARTWQGYGTAKAMASANVPARITATVVEVPKDIEDGQHVTKGQLLVRLDDSDFLRQHEIAVQHEAETDSQITMLEIERTRLAERLDLETQDQALAHGEWQRVKSFRADNASNQQDLDRAKRSWIAAQRTVSMTQESLDKLDPRKRQLEAQRKGLHASAELARQNLQRCRIVSPLDGILQAVQVEVGENVVAGQQVARVVDRRRMELPLQLPASARPDVAVGNEVVLTATNQTGLTWTTRLSRIAPEDDAFTRTMTVFVEVDQRREIEALAANDDGPPGLLTPGMFVAGVVRSDRTLLRWVVPRRAVRAGRLFLVADGVIRSCVVRVDFLFEGKLPIFGLADEQWAVLDNQVDAASLARGDLVVVNASRAMLEGSQVKPKLSATAHAAAPPAPPVSPRLAEEARP
jgi:multidrug resistance efflux pump